MEYIANWCPALDLQYKRILSSTRMTPNRIGKNPLFCDEFPLYTRYSQLGFIEHLDPMKRDAAILRMAVQFWIESESSVARRNLKIPYVLCLSIWDWCCDDPINPYIFFCGTDELYDISSNLILTSSDSSASIKIVELLEKISADSNASIVSDLATVKGDVRVFVDFKNSISMNKVPIDRLCEMNKHG